MYANVAVDAPVDKTFDYHIPAELEGQLVPGHLVQVAFGTAMQHAIVLALHDDTPVHNTKPILARLDPRPVVNDAQIAISQWLSETYLAPIGPCLWLWLPPGLTGHRDIMVELLNAEGAQTALEKEIVALLQRRGPLRGHQLNLALPGKEWRAVVDDLSRAGVVKKESTLTPPRVKPKIVQTAALAIHPDQIPAMIKHLERPSRTADLLQTIADAPNGGFSPQGAVKLAGAAKANLEKLVSSGMVAIQDETVTLAIPADDVPGKLAEMRKTEIPMRVLKVLARASDAMDVSWIFAQTGASMADLKRLEEEELILLGETQKWRDSMAAREFVALTAPPLTPEQSAVWEPLRESIIKCVTYTPPPTPPRIQGGGSTDLSPSENYGRWRVPSALYDKIKPLARQLRTQSTLAEDHLWQSLRNMQTENYKFRRQHPIDRFIVDFYCSEARLVVEVDGDIYQYTQIEDALRQEFLEGLGLRVIRFSNDEVLHEVGGVINRIIRTLKEQERILAQNALTPLPEFGEGSGVGLQNTFLLHGVTGSGKTEIYLRAIELTLSLGRSAIFLVPEIALTPQTLRRVAARFPGKVAVVHSGLSEGERYDTWRRARDGLVQIIVGARSALFTPLPDVGLIVLDEEHDSSYKQSPPVLPPYYHTRQVAEEMMKRQNNGVVIVGSATPDIETFYRSEMGEITRLTLPRRIMGHRVRIQEQAERQGVMPSYRPDDAGDALTIDLPPVRVVDMRDELKRGNTSIFSRSLHSGIAEVLERNEQAILFLNRRGQNTYVFCRDCGYVVKCPRCDMPLTYHRHGQALRCHRCDYMGPEPVFCPQCSSRRIKFFGAGTQQVEQTLIELFPQARVVRWDADTADSPEAHDAILQRFVQRKADVMVGTQMVAKGLDLPLVTLVGVISADVGLGMPDFRAGERTFQVLTQVAGRAGRGLLGGKVILQTYQPEHYAITAAAKHDYKTFYEREIAYRRDLGYPPFRRIVRILFRFPNEVKAKAEAERAAMLLRRHMKARNMTGTELIGPAPCFFTKENRVFRWHLLLRGPDPIQALHGIDFPKGWHVDVDPVEVL
jgi:primosomal protein N'